MAIQQPTTNIDDLLQQLLAQNSQYASSVGNQQTFNDILGAAIKGKFNNNQDLINLQSQNASNYFNAPSEARVKYANIFDPAIREQLASQYANQQGRGLENASQLLQERRGSIADIVGQGVGAYQANLQGQQAALQGTQNTYNMAYQKHTDELNQQFQQRQFDYQKTQDVLNRQFQNKQSASQHIKDIINSGELAVMNHADVVKLAATSSDYSASQLWRIRDQMLKAQKASSQQAETQYKINKPYYKPSDDGDGYLESTEYNRTSIGNAQKLMQKNASRSDVSRYLQTRGYNTAEINYVIGNYQPKKKKPKQPHYSGPGTYNPNNDTYTVLPGQNPTFNY